MAYLWSRPYFFLLLCTALYYTLRTSRVLSGVRHRNIYDLFLREQCTPEVRRQVGLTLLGSIPAGLSSLSWWMLLGMLKLGGAGCLLWYALFSLLWIRPTGALSALWAYYRAPEEGEIGFRALFIRSRSRRTLAPAPLRAGLLGLIQAGVLLCCLCPAGLILPRTLGGPGPRAAFACLLIAAAVRLFLPSARRRAWAVVSILFLAVLAAALLGNLPNLIPALCLVVQDAFQCSSFLFALSGAGLQLVLRGGCQLGTGALALRAALGSGGGPALPHPVCAGLMAQLQALLSLVLHLLLGLFFLCAQLVPQRNAWFQILLWGFLCLFGIERFLHTLRRISGTSRVRRAAGVCGLLLWLLLERLGGAFPAVFWGLLWAGSLGAVCLLLGESGWYFALLEDYRDALLWHVRPHPRISRRHGPLR